MWFIVRTDCIVKSGITIESTRLITTQEAKDVGYDYSKSLDIASYYGTENLKALKELIDALLNKAEKISFENYLKWKIDYKNKKVVISRNHYFILKPFNSLVDVKLNKLGE